MIRLSLRQNQWPGESKIKKIGDYKMWHKIVIKGDSWSDHLPLFFQIAEK